MTLPYEVRDAGRPLAWVYVCAGCEQPRTVTADDIQRKTRPIRCRRCGYDFHQPEFAAAPDAAVDPRLATVARPDRRFLKRCYDASYDFLRDASLRGFDTSEIRLVHGSYDPDGTMRSAHAWVEIGDALVFDGVYQRFCDRDAYYAAMGAVADVTYAAAEAKARFAATGHKGDWHDGSPGVVAMTGPESVAWLAQSQAQRRALGA